MKNLLKTTLTAMTVVLCLTSIQAFGDPTLKAIAIFSKEKKLDTGL